MDEEYTYTRTFEPGEMYEKLMEFTRENGLKQNQAVILFRYALIQLKRWVNIPCLYE
jgi:hypothetical protein|nr:MAG TPA: Putative zinc ribbon domain [Caudoviricetes sp.]